MPLPRVQLRLLLADGTAFGPGKAELLTLIARHGSIAAAGREMKMSYKRAWGLVEEMNRCFRAPLVTTERGGSGHGGAQVTALGTAVLARFRQLEATVATNGSTDLAFIAEVLAPTDGSLPATAETDMFDET